MYYLNMRYIKLFLLLLFPALLWGQENYSGKMSPYTNHFLSSFEYEKRELQKNRFEETAGVEEPNHVMYVNSFIEINDGSDLVRIKECGVKVNSVLGEIITAQVPVDSLQVVAALPDVKRVQIGNPVEEKLDKAREITLVDKVQQGIDLPRSFMGKDVVVGIIDGGFEYGHIDFYASGKEELRIKRVWNQNNASGIPPKDFSYGTELSTISDILSARYDKKSDTHGTHVAGIAIGADMENLYYGVAPQADIVLVSLNKNSADNVAIVDGIKYIYDYAESVNKPCVINLSLGSYLGPHDGTSIFDICCDNLQGKGRLLVGAAGNEGRTNLHVSKTISPSDTLKTFFPSYSCIDIWGEADKTYDMRVVVYSKNTHKTVFTSDIITVSKINQKVYSLSESQDGASGKISITTENNPRNNKANAYLEFRINSIAADHYIGLMIWGEKGKVHVWGDKQTLFSDNEVEGWNEGDTQYTVNEVGGTGKRIISVGAYISKNEYTNIGGESITTGQTVGEIASFSSLGPTADNRMKPDISAPGAAIVSSFSSVMAIQPSQQSALISESVVDRSKFYYGVMSGTSMSAPFITGVLATWLEANPDLTPEAVRSILISTAVKSRDMDENMWGYGKIDAWDGLKEALNLLSVGIQSQTDYQKIIFAPSSGNRKFGIRFMEEDNNVTLSIHTVNGQLVYNQYFNHIPMKHEYSFALPNIDNGIYIISINGNNIDYRSKFIVR